MTRSHRCTGSADSCPVCAARIDAYEDGPLNSDIEAAVRAAEDRYEAHVYGDDYRDWYGDRGRTA